MQGVKIGITGHRGILGSLLTARLANENFAFAAFAGDVTCANAVSEWVQEIRPDVVFHLAAVVPVQKVQANPVEAMRVNGVSNLFLVDAIAKHAPDCWLFYSSTSHVYLPRRAGDGAAAIPESGACDPISLYGATKLAGEKILRPLAAHYGIQTCVGRIFSYFHECQPLPFLVPSLLQRVEQSQPGAILEVVESNSMRDFLHGDAVVDAILCLSAARYDGIVNIGSGQCRTVGSIADEIVRSSGKGLGIKHIYSDHPTSLIANVSRLRSVLSSSQEE
jgi:GDP-4-dehydro-6-deoxy-D-mannose reductase